MYPEKLTIEGKWWFPNSDIKFKGKLTFASGEERKLIIFGPTESFMILDALNSQTQTATQESNQSATQESNHSKGICKSKDDKSIILGESTDKKKITLLYTLTPNKRSERREYYSHEEREFEIEFVFFGIHFKTIEVIQFADILFEYSNLDNWLSDSRLKGRTAIHPSESEGKYLVEHYFGESKDIIIDNICSIKIVSYPDINVDIVTKSTIHNHIFAKITSSGQKTVDEYIILKNIFQDFLNFVINDVVKTLRLVGNVKIKIDDHHITEHVEIFYRNSISKTMDKLNVISPYLLNYQNIAKRFSEILNRWFDLKNKIPSAYDLYFGVMYNSDLYLSNKFLMLTEAIEIYMNYVSKQKLDPDLTDKIARIDHICKVIDECTLNETDREWVKTIIKDKKSLSFKENLRKVFDICQELFPILSSVIGSKQEFSSKIKEYRNRLTHADIDYNQLDNDELSRKCKDLQLVLQLCILSELGFSSSEIKDIYLIPTTAK